MTTVLITLTGLDIGGAETHVVVLCKHLKNMGYNVIVASKGGIYEKDIRDYGIKHYKINLETKMPWGILNALMKLMYIINLEKVDIIHAHARVPAFVCNLLGKFAGVKLVTTAHAKFKSSYFLKYVSAWGQRTIAVSDDIKEHLIHAFDVEQNQIALITNGIDTDQFKSGIDCSDLAREFGIHESRPKVLWVSRMDESLGETVQKLIEAVGEVYREFTDLAVIIAGSGNMLDYIRKNADDKNRELGREVIHIAGGRTDINKLINFSDVFVGISRAALEAMACEVPVILAGPWSFGGILDQDNIESAKKDNFTGRRLTKPVSAGLLAESIIDVLKMDKDVRNQLGKYGRKIVVENYSAIEMAGSTAKVYEDILGKGEK